MATSDQDFDLNIAPIIDCFTVLIAYLLISASFVSIGFFDVGVTTTQEVSAPTQPPVPQEFMSVGLGGGGKLDVKLSGPETSVVSLPPKGGGGLDIEALRAELGRVRARWPALAEASVNGEPAVQYQEIVQVVEALKKELPKVYVGD